ncbi:MAG: hypothetical protein AB7T49_18595 [Oligoflexales bacterium]
MKAFKTLLKQCLTLRATQIDIVPDQYVVVSVDGKANPLKNFGKPDKQALKELMQSLFPKDRDKLRSGQPVKGMLTIVNVGNVYMVGVPLKLSVHIFLSEAGKQQADIFMSAQGRAPTNLPTGKPKAPPSGMSNVTTKNPEPMRLTGFDSDQVDESMVDASTDGNYLMDGASIAKKPMPLEARLDAHVEQSSSMVDERVEIAKPRDVALDMTSAPFEIERKGTSSVVEPTAPATSEMQSGSSPLYSPSASVSESMVSENVISERVEGAHVPESSESYVLETKVKDISAVMAMSTAPVESDVTEPPARMESVESSHPADPTPDMRLVEIVAEARDKRASSIHLRGSDPVFLRIDGTLHNNYGQEVSREDIDRIVTGLVKGHRYDQLLRNGCTEFYESMPDLGRCNFKVFFERGEQALIVTPIYQEIPYLSVFGLSDYWNSVSTSPGLVLVLSEDQISLRKVLASLVENINEHSVKHIVSYVEDACFEHKTKNSIISHMENGSAQPWEKQDADVVVVSQISGKHTIRRAFEMVQRGGLVVAGCTAKSITDGLRAIKNVIVCDDPRTSYMFTSSLNAIFCVKSITSVDRTLCYAHEALLMSEPVRKELELNLASDLKDLLRTMDARGASLNESLLVLMKAGSIGLDIALRVTDDQEDLMTRLHEAGMLGQSSA